MITLSMNGRWRLAMSLVIGLAVLAGGVAAMAQSSSPLAPQGNWSIDCAALQKVPNGEAFVVTRDTEFVDGARNNRFGEHAGQLITRRQVNYMGTDLYDIVADKCGSI